LPVLFLLAYEIQLFFKRCFFLTSLPDWGVMKFVLAELDAGPLKVPGRVQPQCCEVQDALQGIVRS
jgi:hypothetical protein